MNRRNMEFKSAGAGDDDGDEVKSAIQALAHSTTEALTKMGKGVKALETQIDDVEKKLNRRGLGGGAEEVEQRQASQAERKAFTTFMRHGREALSADEAKAMTVGDDPSGGYLVPPAFVAEILKNIVQYSPVRQAARVGQMTSSSIILPRRTGTPTASWVGETETRPPTSESFGQIEITAFEMAGHIDVSNKLLEDSAVDIEAELNLSLGEECGRLEGIAFVNGNGIKKPMGFLQESTISALPSGHATLITADGLIDALYALKPYYRARATWMMNGSTIAAVRKLKDTTGQYLWQPSIAAGQPETILGRPVIEAVDMPDVAAAASPIVIGDFQTGFRVYDRVGISILRDPFSIATTGQTRFHFRRRVAGATVVHEAIKKVTVGV